MVYVFNDGVWRYPNFIVQLLLLEIYKNKLKQLSSFNKDESSIGAEAKILF